ncbi:MAG TPA: beta-galactosidase trimerization domain-containing protein, partial [Anaerolineae bacterium]|nr:beta-galactosidase trimerization domain-containing protein [Anaerolineae bacterium]
MSALNQSTGAGYWWYLNVLNPDWRLSKSGEWTDRATRELREGLGKLIHACDLTVAPVALHYSQASCRGSYARGNLQGWNNARAAWSKILMGLGLQHTFLSYDQLEKGELTFPKTRLLILPYSVAMSEAEVNAVREFVKAGGYVIADVQTAVMDEHCRERNEGALDDVFGMKRMDGGTGHVAGEAKLNAPAWGLEGADLRCKLEEPSLTLKGGQALLAGASAPGVIVNKHGAGRTIYLGFGMARYIDMAPRQEGAAMRQMLAAILREAGVQWPVMVREGKDALNPPEVEVYHYALGEQEFLGLFPTNAKEGVNLKVTVSLASPRLARELRSGRDLGRVARFDVELTAPYAQFFSLLPSAVKSVSAEAPAKVKLGQPVNVSLAVATEDGKPGMRVVRVTVKDPAGERVVRWESNETLTDGRGAKTLNLALNDPAGRYVVSARDVASGVTCERAFVAEPAERLSREGEAEKYPPAV